MGLETYTGNIADMVATNPQPTDPKSQGDDHLRGIKYTLQQSFPNFDGPLNAGRVPFTPVGGIQATNVQAALQEVDAEKAPILSGVPVGAVMDFARQDAPSGWLSCDGAAVSRTTYAALFSVIGTQWGAGDGSTTFNVPDTRGRFRATGGSDGAAATKTFGQKLGDAIRNITGNAGAVYRATGTGASGAISLADYGQTPAKPGVIGADPGDSVNIQFDASLSVPTANENRPFSIVFATFIKT